ncbi:hypothetical protein ACS0TY_014612 [Phlomoides rotata]
MSKSLYNHTYPVPPSFPCNTIYLSLSPISSSATKKKKKEEREKQPPNLTSLGHGSATPAPSHCREGDPEPPPHLPKPSHAPIEASRILAGVAVLFSSFPIDHKDVVTLLDFLLEQTCADTEGTTLLDKIITNTRATKVAILYS